MVRKPEYIEKLEDGKLFSTVEINVPDEFQKFLDGRSLTTVYTDSWIDYETAKFNTRSKIYSTKQPFYLYLFKSDLDGKTLVIYYKEEQINELKLFISQLLKTFKNGTTNNK
jgi:hypothetical protein